MNADPDAIDNETLRRWLLIVLGRARRPLTSAELRERVNATGGTTHDEAVYRNLLVLENRRRVRRQQLNGRNVTWTLQPTRPALNVRLPVDHINEASNE